MNIRSIRQTDAQGISDATNETWTDLSKWMRWATDKDKLTDLKNCLAYASQCEKLFLESKDFTFGGFLKTTGDLVLISRLAFLNADDNTFELCGYWCRKTYQRQGLMKEAVRSIILHAFNDLGAKSIQIKHASGNTATRSVIEYLGFTNEIIVKNAHDLPDGSVVDEHTLYIRDLDVLPI